MFENVVTNILSGCRRFTLLRTVHRISYVFPKLLRHALETQCFATPCFVHAGFSLQVPRSTLDEGHRLARVCTIDALNAVREWFRPLFDLLDNLLLLTRWFAWSFEFKRGPSHAIAHLQGGAVNRPTPREVFGRHVEASSKRPVLFIIIVVGITIDWPRTRSSTMDSQDVVHPLGHGTLDDVGRCGKQLLVEVSWSYLDASTGTRETTDGAHFSV